MVKEYGSLMITVAYASDPDGYCVVVTGAVPVYWDLIVVYKYGDSINTVPTVSDPEGYCVTVVKTVPVYCKA